MGRLIRTLLVLAFLVAFAAVAWVAVRGSQARTHLEDAADGVSTLQRQVSRMEIEEARRTLDGVQADTDRARQLTSDPVWRTLAAFPWGGQNLAAVETATGSVDRLADEGLPGLLAAGEGVSTFRASLEAGELDAAPLQQVTDGVAALDASLEDTRADIRGIDRSYLVRAISRALDDLQESLELADGAGANLVAEVAQGGGS